MNNEIRTIGVLGAGTMGSGIAQVGAQIGGYNIILADIDSKVIDSAVKKIEKNLADFWVSKGKLAEKERDEILLRIKTTVRLEDMKNADYIIEAVPEKLELKLDIFKKLDALCSENVILSTNTSVMSITKMASVTRRPQMVVGMHFSNPAQIMRRLEIIKGLETSEETARIAIDVGRKMGKNPRLTRKDYPGFTGNRLLPLYVNESFNLIDQGVVAAEDLDEGVKEGLGHRMGPLETADLIGLDILLDLTEYLYREYGEKYKPSPLLKKLVEAGHLGRKTGKGVYDYTEGSKKPRILW